MDALVISDLHLGSEHVHLDALEAFLRTVPTDIEFVINGDLLDLSDTVPLPTAHQAIVDGLVDRASRQRVVWVQGNHDENVDPARYPGIEIVARHAIGDVLYIEHGHGFDNIMPHHRLFIRLFKRLHALRIALGAEPIHVAHYAKKWAILYRHLRRHVLNNAVHHAREAGFDTVTCGHTHFAEDLTRDGVRYINTGSWTESPSYVVTVSGRCVDLMPIPDAGSSTAICASQTQKT